MITSRSFTHVAALISVATILTLGAGCSKARSAKQAQTLSQPTPSLNQASKPGPAPKPTAAPVIPAEASKVPRPY